MPTDRGQTMQKDVCIWKQHRDYLRGLHHFMSTDSRVPQNFRSHTAGVAAVQAIDENTSVQDIDRSRYQKKLRDLGQVLEWSSMTSSLEN